MLHCGKLDDVCAYEKMRRPPAGHEESTPQPPFLAKLAGRRSRASSFSEMAPEVECPHSPSSSSSSSSSARLSSKKSMSFRWITRQSSGSPGNSKRIVTQDVKASNLTSSAPVPLPPKPKAPSSAPTAPRRVGFMDILVGYQSLLHPSSSFHSATMQRKQLHPTIGFLHHPDHGTQR